MDTSTSKCHGLLRGARKAECEQWPVPAIRKFADPETIRRRAVCEKANRSPIFRWLGTIAIERPDTTPEGRDPQKNAPHPHG